MCQGVDFFTHGVSKRVSAALFGSLPGPTPRPEASEAGQHEVRAAAAMADTGTTPR